VSAARRTLLVTIALGLLSAVLVTSAHAAPRYVFWDNDGPRTIGRAQDDGTNVNQRFLTGLTYNDGTASVADATYVYYGVGGTLMRARVDGTGTPQPLVQLTSAASSLAIDSGHIYIGSFSRVSRVDISGANLVPNFITATGAPSGNYVEALAVDQQHVYWAAPGGIGRANIDGTGAAWGWMATGPTAGVAVDSEHVYWPDNANGSIGRANIDGSNPDPSWIPNIFDPSDGAYDSLRGLYVDYGHVWWAHDYHCDYVPQPPGPCGGGSIGRANIDGSGADDTFIPSEALAGPGCGTDPDTRCGPKAVALTPQTEPVCLNVATAPPAPTGGAVFHRAGATGTNTVVLPPGTSWTGDASCGGTGSAQVMASPTSIAVSPGTAVSLTDGTRTSAWGGQTTPAGGPAPVLFPGDPGFAPTSATLTTPQALLQASGGCAGCAFPAETTFTPPAAVADTAYTHSLSGAQMDGATLQGDFSGWDLSDAHLGGATLNRTNVSGTVFSGADLRAAQLTSLVTNVPPVLNDVRFGSLSQFAGSTCTTFTDTDLLGAGLTVVPADIDAAGCEANVFPGSTVPMTTLADFAVTADAPTFPLGGANYVVTPGSADALKGANLEGLQFSGSRFSGFPADLSGANLNYANLRGSTFDLADLSNATFRFNVTANDASFVQANLTGAQFNSASTVLQDADFIGATISGATFQGADLTNASFVDVLANGTSFDSAIARGTSFNGAHIYSEATAFSGVRNLQGASFVGAVLAGNTDGSGAGLSFTGADLTGANFSLAQCIFCDFTSATMDDVNAIGAYLPGAQFGGGSFTNAQFARAWLFCGDPLEALCEADVNPGQFDWPLALGTAEDYGPVAYSPTDVSPAAWTAVANCPDNRRPDPATGCAGFMTPDATLTLPTSCSAAALGACPTNTTTLFDAGSAAAGPLALAPASPATWSSTVGTDGTYAAFANGTIGLVDPNAGPTPSTVAGSATARCTTPAAPCGDGGPATAATLDSPTGLAVGLDGSLYIADPALLRVRRIAPNGTISTVAGTGQACTGTAGCGDGGSAVAAQLADPQGVWVDPAGQIYIADGTRGIRRVGLDGTIATVASGAYDVVSVTGDASGTIWAAANDPDYLLEVNVTAHTMTPVVGTGTSGYNGASASPATGVQVNRPGSLSMTLDGLVVFADTGNHLIRAYDPASAAVIDDIAGVAGTGGYNGDGRDAQHTQLNAPRAVAATRGALYVVGDTGNGRVRQVGPSAMPSSPGTQEPGAQPGSPTRPSVTSRPVVRAPVASGDAPRSPGARVRPDNRFTVGSVRVRRDGTVTLRVRVRAAGRLRGVVTVRRNGRTWSFATGAAGIRNATTVTLRATPTKRARDLVGRGHERLRLALAVTFRPTGGDARTVAVRGLRLAATRQRSQA